MIRLATPSDAKDILSIYSPYILNTAITFETEVPELEEFRKRMSHYLERYPWLVFESDGSIAGYTYASSYRERIAYQWCLECSVYVAEGFQRKGIARQLYRELFRILKRQGFTTVYAVITIPNEPSVSLHESMGFTYFATYENVGFKCSAWRNVGWWQLTLNPPEENPLAPTPFCKIIPEIERSLEQLKP